jgi:hypothetical protein
MAFVTGSLTGMTPSRFCPRQNSKDMSQSLFRKEILFLKPFYGMGRTLSNIAGFTSWKNVADSITSALRNWNEVIDRNFAWQSAVGAAIIELGEMILQFISRVFCDIYVALLRSSHSLINSLVLSTFGTGAPSFCSRFPFLRLLICSSLLFVSECLLALLYCDLPMKAFLIFPDTYFCAFNALICRFKSKGKFCSHVSVLFGAHCAQLSSFLVEWKHCGGFLLAHFHSQSLHVGGQGTIAQQNHSTDETSVTPFESKISAIVKLVPIFTGTTFNAVTQASDAKLYDLTFQGLVRVDLIGQLYAVRIRLGHFILRNRLRWLRVSEVASTPNWPISFAGGL